MTEKWPLDVERLSKGDYISPDRCEEILGAKRDAKDYSLLLLGLSETIRREGERVGKQLPCRCLKDGIEVMTDNTAAIYYKKQFEAGLRQCGRSHRRQIRLVDRSALTTETQRQYDRTIALQSMLLLSNKTVVRKFNSNVITNDNEPDESAAIAMA